MLIRTRGVYRGVPSSMADRKPEHIQSTRNDAGPVKVIDEWSYRARLGVIVSALSIIAVGAPPAILCWSIVEYPLGAIFGDLLWTVIVPVFFIITPVCWGLAAARFAEPIRASLRTPELNKLPFNRMVLMALVMAVVFSILFTGILDGPPEFRLLRLGGELFLFAIAVSVLGYPFAAIGTAMIFMFIRRYHDRLPLPREFAAHPRRCLNCQYDLTGNASGVCPECGYDLAQGKAAGIDDAPS